MAKKLSETVKLNLRFSEELRRKLEKAAERKNQSMNLEIVERLEHSFTLERLDELLDRKIDVAIQVAVKQALHDVGVELLRREGKPELSPVEFYWALAGKTKGDEK
jgi:hypothetical protein